MAPTTVPVTITPEAAERLAELGMQRELDLTIEHTKQTVPGLHAITVVLEPCYDTRDEPGITIEASIDPSQREYDPTDRDWGRWKVETFPPEVCEHFVMMTTYRTTDDR
jgi:hypothetical protein